MIMREVEVEGRICDLILVEIGEIEKKASLKIHFPKFDERELCCGEGESELLIYASFLYGVQRNVLFSFFSFFFLFYTWGWGLGGTY